MRSGNRWQEFTWIVTEGSDMMTQTAVMMVMRSGTTMPVPGISSSTGCDRGSSSLTITSHSFFQHFEQKDHEEKSDHRPKES